MAESPAEMKRRGAALLRVLKRTVPEAKCSLNYQNPFQLLVATILSAQCTDERVNAVTPALFKRFPGPSAMARATLSEIEMLIRSTGFYKNKALSLLSAARAILETHGGEVPSTLEDLVQIRGIGRKTANVVLGNVFNIPSMVVDTHVGRLSRRMGFTRSHDPVHIEHELMEIFPKRDWVLFSHLFIAHGRKICTARRAYCERCPVARHCPNVGVVKR